MRNNQNDALTFTGSIEQIYPGPVYLVVLADSDVRVHCTLSGRMKKPKSAGGSQGKQKQISLMIGDSVQVELSEYDLTKGRIVYRNKII